MSIFNCHYSKSPSSNILLDFASLHNAYVAPDIYKYQINPISNSYNENVLFGDDDNTYLNENEKIQYTIYKDNPFGGGGGSGLAGSANTGAGGGGANSGRFGGGGAGAYIEAVIPNPVSSYSYTVGNGGTAGSGGAGGSGVIIIEEYYT